MRLEDHKNRKPFSTPDCYFEELNRSIIEATSKVPAKPVAKKSHYIGTWARTLGYAAALAIVAIVTVKALVVDTTENTTAQNAGSTQEELIYDNEFYDALLENYTIDDYTFYCCLTEYE